MENIGFGPNCFPPIIIIIHKQNHFYPFLKVTGWLSVCSLNETNKYFVSSNIILKKIHFVYFVFHLPVFQEIN